MIQAIIGALIGVGLYLILADAMKVPLLSTVTAFGNLNKRQKKKTRVIDSRTASAIENFFEGRR